MESVIIEGTTIPYAVTGRSGSGSVYMRPAEKGHGVIAAAPVSAVMQAAGISDVTAKCIGSRNPHNMVRATFDGMRQLRSFETIAARRGKTMEYLQTG